MNIIKITVYFKPIVVLSCVVILLLLKNLEPAYFLKIFILFTSNKLMYRLQKIEIEHFFWGSGALQDKMLLLTNLTMI